jgi:hypothetical protein
MNSDISSTIENDNIQTKAGNVEHAKWLELKLYMYIYHLFLI